MTGRADVDEIKSRIDPYQIVSKYVRLEKAGNRYRGLCPFHQEKTPSFHLDPQTGLYYCFGCHAGGDIVKFVMEIEGWSFVEAMNYLAEEVGLVFAVKDTQSAGEKDRLFGVTDKLSRYYRRNLNLPEAEEARAYLRRRGLSEEIQERGMLGYALPGWDNLSSFAKRSGITVKDLVDLGLLKESNNPESRQRFYDQFRNRIIFPIKDVSGRIIGFGGRTLGTEEPKYLNSSDSVIYHKSNSLYGLQQARMDIRQEKTVLLAEGYMDVLSLWQYGFPHTVASLGTAFTERQAELLRRYAEKIIVCYDGDNAGVRAAQKAVEILSNIPIQTFVAMIPEGMDPDDYLKKYGAESFQTEVLNKAMTGRDFEVLMISRDFNLAVPTEKIAFAGALAEYLSKVENHVEQAGYLSLYAEQYDLDKSALTLEVRRRGSSRRQAAEERKTDPKIEDKKRRYLEKILLQERKLLNILINNKEKTNCSFFSNQEHREICRAISEDGLSAQELEEKWPTRIAGIVLLPEFTEIKEELESQLELISIQRELRITRKKISEAVKIGDDPMDLLRRLKALEQRMAEINQKLQRGGMM